MPAETDRHERTLMAWPTVGAPHRAVARTARRRPRGLCARSRVSIAEHEPVTMVAAPVGCGRGRRDVRTRRRGRDRCRSTTRGSATPDRSSCVAPDGARHAVHFRFNAWGEKYDAVRRGRATIGARIAHPLGLPVHEAPLVLEGGSIAVDGTGTLVTTERCLLNPNRNPGWDAREIEHALRAGSVSTRIVWLADGIAEDDGDRRPRRQRRRVRGAGACVLQGCCRSAQPEPRDRRRQPRRACEAAGIDVVEIADAAVRVVSVRVRCRFPTSTSTSRTGSSSCRSRAAAEDDAALDVDRGRVSRTRGRRGSGRGPRLRWRRRALHHPAGPGHDPPHRVRRASTSPARVSTRRAGRRCGSGSCSTRWHRRRRRRTRAALREGVRIAAGTGAQLGVPARADARALLRDHARRPGRAPVSNRGAAGWSHVRVRGRTRGRDGRRGARVAVRTRRRRWPRVQHRDLRRARRHAARAHAQDAPARHGRLLRGQVLPRRRHAAIRSRRSPGAVVGFPTCWDEWFPEVARAVRAAAAPRSSCTRPRSVRSPTIPASTPSRCGNR